MKNIELNRKLFHLSSLWIPLLIEFTPRHFSLNFLGFCMIFCLIIEIIKLRISAFNNSFNRVFESILRDQEKTSYITGATFFIIGSYLTLVFTKPPIASIAIVILIISDTCASMIGINYGKVKFWNKSLEGSSAFFIATFFIMILANQHYNLQYTLTKIFLISFITTFIELFSGKIGINDNLSIPITAAFLMSYI